MNRLTEFHTAFNRRIYSLYIIFGVLLLALILALGYRQLVLGRQYHEKEQQQCLRRIVHPGTRGIIYDRNGAILAQNKTRYSLVLCLGELRFAFKEVYYKKLKAARRSKVKINRLQLQQEARYEVVSQYITYVSQLLELPINISKNQIEEHFSKQLLTPVVLIESLTPEHYGRLLEKLPVSSPMQIIVDALRFYPYGSLASHVLGYVTLKTNTKPIDDETSEALTTLAFKRLEGQAGLEKQFESLLQGCSGEEIWVVDTAGYQCNMLYSKPAQQGISFACTLDIELQKIAEKALGNMYGAVVAIDIESQEVLVLASKPDFDPNQLMPKLLNSVYDEINERHGWFNRALQGLYPPASPFKIVTASALLREGVIDSETKIDCKGFSQVGNRKFKCKRTWGHGPIELITAIGKSCNPYFYESALKLDPDSLSQEACMFGFDKPTGIELPYEAKSMLVPNTHWKKDRKLGPWTLGDTANMCIGQGYLRVTPLQMACFGAAFASGQERITPTLIHRPEAEAKERVRYAYKPLELSQADHDLIVQGMVQAIQSGTASKRIQIPGITVAGKTGTGQVYVSGKEMNIAWFLGFAPAKFPKIAVVVMLEEQGAEDHFYGGSTAAPVASKVFMHYFKTNTELNLQN